ncbi:hypothetical protein ACFVVM_32925 [Nocardia sp. NPDC058176]|uniref:hypothetical protein n=1 Tax=Nocardia sp. NPDC058176 TaxID=3346368 RepID=UPI0036DD0BCA
MRAANCGCAPLGRSADVAALVAACEHVLGELATSCVVVAMFTDGVLSCVASLTPSGASELDELRDLVVRQQPDDVAVVAIAPVREASAIWEAAETVCTVLATTVVVTATVYTHTSDPGSPVVDLSSTRRQS